MKRRVLIIDNDPVIHVSLLGVLSNNEIEVYSVYNPIDGLQWLEKSSADLIICDIGLPKMNGLEFVRQLRQKNRTMGVLFFTGGEVQIAKTELKRLNIIEVINKANYDVFYFKHRVYDYIFGYDPTHLK